MQLGIKCYEVCSMIGIKANINIAAAYTTRSNSNDLRCYEEGKVSLSYVDAGDA